ncbi:MAG: Flp pilus assembly protein CpaB [Pseudomonadota bacterium]|nr:Flp pilus assembly protein CpaB [Pseudomonadota bacterium]
MKNQRAVIVMGVAVLSGLAAVSIAASWVIGPAGGSGDKIVVASADINLGQRLTPEMLKIAEWPTNTVPANAFTNPAKLNGRVLKTSLLVGEPLSEAKLAPVGTLGGLSALITEGKRAITVRVNDVVGVAGFALPGNYVDIIVSTASEPTGAAAQREQIISKIVLDRILVLAVAQEVNRDETKPRVVNAVTLEVTPAQAEALDLARTVGTLSLALRNQIDPTLAVTLGATKLTLLPVAAIVAPIPKPVVKPVARPAPPAVQKVAVVAQRTCTTVINGLRPASECF